MGRIEPMTVQRSEYLKQLRTDAECVRDGGSADLGRESDRLISSYIARGRILEERAKVAYKRAGLKNQ